jgi:hypothetical protein
MLNFWKRKGFEILIGITVIIIIIGAIFRIGKKGTYETLNNYKDRVVSNSLRSLGTKPNENSPIKIKREPIVSKSEGLCRRVLENYFGKPFNKARPDFLRNPVTGGNFNLEIDCYNPELKLGVEYQGKQHAEYVPFFHSSKEAFLNQKYRDELKRRMCRDNGVKLIEVPYTVKYEQVEKYLINELKKNGY